MMTLMMKAIVVVEHSVMVSLYITEEDISQPSTVFYFVTIDL